MTPRILFSDRKLSKTDIHVLGLITSLTLKIDYCYASNEYLANYINVSKRTISDSLSKLKKLKYIKIKFINSKRRIYLNTEKVPTKPNKKEDSIPYWMEPPEVCTNEETTSEEIEELNRLLEEF